MKMIGILLIQLLILPYGFAATESPKGKAKNFCGDKEKISKLVDTCDANAVIAKVALLCAIRMEKRSKDTAAKLVESLSKGADAQSGSFAANEANLAKADLTLASLEGTNDLAIKDTLSLFLNLVHPDELYEISPKADANAFLKDTPCFRDNKRKLLISLTELEKNKNGIISARDALKSMKGKTGIDMKGLLSAALGPVSGNRSVAPPKAAPVPKGNQRQEESDITGTNKKKEKL